MSGILDGFDRPRDSRIAYLSSIVPTPTNPGPGPSFIPQHQPYLLLEFPLPTLALLRLETDPIIPVAIHMCVESKIKEETADAHGVEDGRIILDGVAELQIVEDVVENLMRKLRNMVFIIMVKV